MLHPADGYRRLKPPSGHLPDTAYGSSILIGPIEEAGRPVVDLAAVDVDPVPAGRFRLVFARGGSGSVQLEKAEPGHATLRIRLDPPLTGGRPFAALRSMFVSPAVADAADVTWRPATDAPWQTQPVMAFSAATVASARFGRNVPSSHNTSAPNLTFDAFTGQ